MSISQFYYKVEVIYVKDVIVANLRNILCTDQGFVRAENIKNNRFTYRGNKINLIEDVNIEKVNSIDLRYLTKNSTSRIEVSPYKSHLLLREGHKISILGESDNHIKIPEVGDVIHTTSFPYTEYRDVNLPDDVIWSLGVIYPTMSDMDSESIKFQIYKFSNKYVYDAFKILRRYVKTKNKRLFDLNIKDVGLNGYETYQIFKSSEESLYDIFSSVGISNMSIGSIIPRMSLDKLKIFISGVLDTHVSKFSNRLVLEESPMRFSFRPNIEDSRIRELNSLLRTMGLFSFDKLFDLKCHYIHVVHSLSDTNIIRDILCNSVYFKDSKVDIDVSIKSKMCKTEIKYATIHQIRPIESNEAPIGLKCKTNHLIIDGCRVSHM